MRRFDRRHFKWWWQRRTRGFDDRDTWCLATNILEYALPRLKAYPRSMVAPGPLCYREDGSEVPIKEATAAWDETRDKMVRAMEIWVKDGGAGPIPGTEEETELDEGMDLFFKHFFHLWW